MGSSRSSSRISARAHARLLDRTPEQVASTVDGLAAIVRRPDLLTDQLADLLDGLLVSLGCDRAWLIHPCRPDARSYSVLMERTVEQWPGAMAAGAALPMDGVSSEVFRCALGADGAQSHGPGGDWPLPSVAADYGVKSQLLIVVRPAIGDPWLLGVHHCEQPHRFRRDERDILEGIAGHLADALTALLSLQRFEVDAAPFRISVRERIEGRGVGPGPQTDLLEQRVAESLLRLRQRDKAVLQGQLHALLGDVLGYVAHQWRQPLSTIRALAGSVRLQRPSGSPDVDRVEAALSQIEAQAQVLSETIDDFRTFFQAEHEARRVDVHEIVQRALAIVEPSFAAHGIHVHCRVPAARLWVQACPNALSRALYNILSNASSVLERVPVPQRHVLIDGRLDQDEVVVEAQDLGGGVPEPDLEHVFDPYFTTGHPAQGTGLGLWISHQVVVRQHGGRLSVHNRRVEVADTSAVGACFVLRIPAASQEGPAGP